MIRKDKCLICAGLFSLSGYNRIRFCDGSQGKFIDNYDNQKELFNDFKSKKNYPASCCKEKYKPRNLYSRKDLFNSVFNRSLNSNLGQSSPRYLQRFFCFPNFYCNNNCQHCFIPEDLKASRTHLSLDTLKSLIRKNAKNCSYLHIGGGEPTLFEGILELISYSRSLNLKIRIFSNCRRMSNSDFSRQIARSGISSITVPIHSQEAQVHDFITQRKGSFNQTMQGIKNLKQNDFHNIHVIVVVQRINYQHLPDIAAFLIKQGVKIVSFESLAFSGSAAKNFRKISVRASKVAPYLERAFDILAENGRQVYTSSFPLCLFNKRYWKFFLNERYCLFATNVPYPPDNYSNPGFKYFGTSLSKRCIDCSLKIFCPGIWFSYYHYLGDKELKAINNGSIPDKFKFFSKESIKRIFSEHFQALNS